MRPAALNCVVVTGLSGAGKSLALHALEDLGYFCVDNFPLELLPSLLAHYRHAGQRLTRIAVGVDVRTGTGDFRDALASLKRQGVSPRVLFLDADNNTLLRRFSETRRRHPLGGSVISGIQRERRHLNEVKSLADKILDTSQLTPNEMKVLVARTLGLKHARRLAVIVTSFGYKYGLPMDADLVWDVRFLPNPNYVPALRGFSGKKPSVSKFVLRNPHAKKFVAFLKDIMDFLLEQYNHEGKSYLTVAIGCTGGRHRSVAIAEALGDYIRRGKKSEVRVLHRDIERRL